MATLVGHGAIASTVSPFTAAGVVTNQKLAEIGIEQAAWKVFTWNAAANALAAAIAYVLFGGWRLWTTQPNDPASASKLFEPADVATRSATWRHWLTAIVVGLVLAAVAVGKVHIGLAAFCGAAALVLLRAGDDAAGLAQVPWGVILMVSGVSVLSSLLDKTGGSLRFAGLIGTVSTPATLPAVVALITGVVSIYSSTTGVVLPAFLPMVRNLASLHAGSNPLNLALAVLVGGNLVDMSPLSTIGALCLAAAPADLDRRRLFNQLLAWGFAMALLGMAISAALF
jgi:di/tricarboxylate transporter